MHIKTTRYLQKNSCATTMIQQTLFRAKQWARMKPIAPRHSIKVTHFTYITQPSVMLNAGSRVNIIEWKKVIIVIVIIIIIITVMTDQWTLSSPSTIQLSNHSSYNHHDHHHIVNKKTSHYNYEDRSKIFIIALLIKARDFFSDVIN